MSDRAALTLFVMGGAVVAIALYAAFLTLTRPDDCPRFAPATPVHGTWVCAYNPKGTD